MAEWLYEAGIGEARAALIDNGAIVEARIEPESNAQRAGAIVAARLATQLVPRRRGIVSLETGEEALLEPLPSGLTEGAPLLVEIVRAAIPEPGVAKLAKARPAPDGASAMPGPELLARVGATGHPIAVSAAHGADRLEAAGWSEVLEQAASGDIAFPGGALRIALTPAMTVIDVDGTLAPSELAIAGARGAGEAIRRFDIAGSIGIDLPTLAARAARKAAAEALDEALPPPFERTAVNGFGFLHLIRKRERASLLEIVRHDRVGASARALLRRAERAPGAGNATLRAHTAVSALLVKRADWIAELERRIGAAVRIEADPKLALSAGDCARQFPG